MNLDSNLRATDINPLLNSVWSDSSLSDSVFHSEASLINEFLNYKHQMILSCNIQSLNQNKFNDFSFLLSKLDKAKIFIPVILLQEIWNNNISEFTPPHYQAYAAQRRLGRGGGVAVLVHSSLSAELLSNVSPFVENLIESISVKVSLNNKHFTHVNKSSKTRSKHETIFRQKFARGTNS